MNENIDAKIFIISPDEKHRERVQKVIDDQRCEIYILEKDSSAKNIISHFKKSVLIVDAANYNNTENLQKFITDMLTISQEKLINIIIIDNPEGHISDSRVLSVERSLTDNEEYILQFIKDLNILGPRSYIRFGYKDSRIAFFRMKLMDKWRTGVIHDISASGMSCAFDKHQDIKMDENSTIIELSINDVIFRMTGSFLLRRTFKNDNMFVLVFSGRKNQEHITSLNSIIYSLSRKNVLKKIAELA